MKSFITVCTVFVLCGCARDIDSNVYTSANIDSISKTYEGTVVSVRGVTVKDSESMVDNTAGLLVGGALGGVLGNAVGGGRGRAVTTALGAVGGATAGALAQEKLSKQNAVEYVVKLNNGEMYTFVQGKDVIYGPGQKVLISIGNNSRPRIVGSM